MALKKASISTPVVVNVDPRINNGIRHATGFVTQVHGSDEDDDQRVNVRVFLDTGENLRLANLLFTTAAAAKKADDEENANAAGVQQVCWPA
jgi:hypothetical protein